HAAPYQASALTSVLPLHVHERRGRSSLFTTRLGAGGRTSAFTIGGEVGGGRLPGRERGLARLGAVIGAHDGRHEVVANHVAVVEVDELDAVDSPQHRLDLD